MAGETKQHESHVSTKRGCQGQVNLIQVDGVASCRAKNVILQTRHGRNERLDKGRDQQRQGGNAMIIGG